MLRFCAFSVPDSCTVIVDLPRCPVSQNFAKSKMRKTEYWFTEAGGPTYFGKVNEVTNKEARTLFSEHMKSLSEGVMTCNVLICAELFEHFLE